MLALAERTLLWISVVTLISMALLTFSDVVGRYVFNAPVGGAFEIIGMGMAVLIFAALPEVTARNEHVSVSLVKFLPEGLQKFLQLIMAAIVAGSLGVLAWRLLEHANRLHDFGDYAMFTGVPLAPVAWFMAFCAGLAAVFRGVRLAMSPDIDSAEFKAIEK
ncbi:TRAP transporter small permease [Sulfitobacter sp. 1A13421]|uniref:TRAP transporter small permease n=1 Tax=Sulfitobacter sp. 1A13421 TaxID=3368595 RepID=UPI0037469EAE